MSAEQHKGVQPNQHQREEELRSTVKKNACCFITLVFKFRRVGLLCEIVCFNYIVLEEVLKSIRLSIGEGEVVQHSDHIGRKVERKEREEVDELENIEEVPLASMEPLRSRLINIFTKNTKRVKPLIESPAELTTIIS